MFRLVGIIYALAGPTLAGILIVAALASGLDTMEYVVGAGLGGFAAAIPVAYFVGRYIYQTTSGPGRQG